MILLVVLVVIFVAVVAMLMFANQPAMGGVSQPACCGGRNPRCPMCRCNQCGSPKSQCGCPRMKDRREKDSCEFC